MFRKYYETWLSHREKYGDQVALLYQVGGFFELYDTENLATGESKANIRRIAELCQLSLTEKPLDADCQTLFGGFPDHALPKFEKILVGAGWTVVVVVQKKGATGAVEERVVEHIGSPGCYVDPMGSLKERRLVGVLLEGLGGGPAAIPRIYWSASALDLATGSLWYAEGSNTDRLHQFLCMHPPAELVVWSDGSPSSGSLTETLKGACAATHVRCLAPAAVSLEEATLRTFWSVPHIIGSLAVQPQARRCLAALLEFARDHVPSVLRSLREPEAWIPDGEVRLGNAALEQLGLVNLRDERKSLLGLMDRCRSSGGRRLLRSRLLRPITDITELERRLDHLAMMKDRDSVSTERGLRSLYDISRLWRRVELGSASMNDMACLLRSFESATALGFADSTGFLAGVWSSWSLAATTELAREDRVIPLAQLPFVGTPELRTLFAEGLALRKEAEALCASWMALCGGGLCLDDAEGGGFRITGTKRRINAVIAALADSTAKVVPYKTTAMLETAALDTLCSKHRSWMRRWGPAWHAAWSAALAALVAESSGAVQTIEAWCAALDVSWTVSLLATTWKWTRPTFVSATQSSLEVTGLRHPILEQLQTVPYISHSLDLGSTTSGVLLYGMNASGKSSLMKAVGLCTLLAQAGFPVPATTCRLAPFSAIFTRILGNDNLWAGLSSFAVEMTEFREILRFADSKSLVLGDELCSGTESLSATALVAAGVETLASVQTKFIFATHLHELAPLLAPIASVKAVHLKVEYDAATDRLLYHRSLAPGSGSALYGLEVCRALDLPLGYLDRATAIRKELAGWSAPSTSAYSSAVAVTTCEVCGSTAGLETHHIIPQAAASTEKSNIHAAGNLVSLCTTCHDDHHGGRLLITGWQDTSAGRSLVWTRAAAAAITEEVRVWLKEQRLNKIRIPTIQRMAIQLFGCELTSAIIKGVK
jgi:DNA mismatch repair protein MutS